MKKAFVMFAVMAIVSVGAIAQNQPAQDPQKSAQQDPQKAAAEKAEWDRTVKAELKLSADQVQKYDAVSKEFGDKMEALKADASLTDDVRKEKKMALKKEKEAKRRKSRLLFVRRQLKQYCKANNAMQTNNDSVNTRDSTHICSGETVNSRQAIHAVLFS